MEGILAIGMIIAIIYAFAKYGKGGGCLVTIVLFVLVGNILSKMDESKERSKTIIPTPTPVSKSTPALKPTPTSIPVSTPIPTPTVKTAPRSSDETVKASKKKKNLDTRPKDTGIEFILILGVLSLFGFIIKKRVEAIRSRRNKEFAKNTSQSPIQNHEQENSSIDEYEEEFPIDQEYIETRLAELAAKEKNLLESKQAILKEGTSERLKPIVTKLEKALSIIEYQRKLIQIESWRLEFVSWLDVLKPITTNWYHIEDREDCDKYLQDVKASRSAGQTILKEWKEHTELIAMPEAENYAGNLEKALEACQDLIDELLAKKAEIAIKGLNVEETPSAQSINKKPFEQLYHIMAITEVQRGEISSIEAKMEEELSNLEIETDFEELYK